MNHGFNLDSEKKFELYSNCFSTGCRNVMLLQTHRYTHTHTHAHGCCCWEGERFFTSWWK